MNNRPLPPRRQSSVSEIAMPAGWGDAMIRHGRPSYSATIRGEEREGKSEFAMSMPGPVAVFPFDNNSQYIVEKWKQRGKKILVPNPPLLIKDASNQSEYEEIFKRFKSLYLDAIASASVRGIVLDTGSDTYELARLALLGRLEQVPPHLYGKVNVQFYDIINKVRQTDKNFAIIHRLKDEYVKGGAKGEGVRTGNRVMVGVQEVKYKVHCSLLCWRDLDRRTEDGVIQGFGVTIDNCTQNAALAGTYIEEPQNTWGALGQLIFPDSTAEDWS